MSFSSVFLQVNGKDVSNLAHEDAVNEFLKADEPILIEVKRRPIAEQSTSIQNAINVSDQQSSAELSAETKSPKEKSISSSASQQQQQQQQSTEMCTAAAQTDLMLCDFDTDFICRSNESPGRIERLNGTQMNQNSIRNINNNNNNNNGHLNHCTMLNDCIVPPEIDIEVSSQLRFFLFFNFKFFFFLRI